MGGGEKFKKILEDEYYWWLSKYDVFCLNKYLSIHSIKFYLSLFFFPSNPQDTSPRGPNAHLNPHRRSRIIVTLLNGRLVVTLQNRRRVDPVVYTSEYVGLNNGAWRKVNKFNLFLLQGTIKVIRCTTMGPGGRWKNLTFFLLQGTIKVIRCTTNGAWKKVKKFNLFFVTGNNKSHKMHNNGAWRKVKKFNLFFVTGNNKSHKMHNNGAWRKVKKINLFFVTGNNKSHKMHCICCNI